MEILILDHRKNYEQEEILKFLLASAQMKTFPGKTLVVDLDNQVKRAELHNGLVEVYPLHSLPGFTKTREISCFEAAHKLTQRSLCEDYPTANFEQGTRLFLEQRLSRYFLRSIYLNKVIHIAAYLGVSTIVLLRRGRNHWEHLLSDEIYKFYRESLLSRLFYCYLEMDLWIQIEGSRNERPIERDPLLDPLNSLGKIWAQERFSISSVAGMFLEESKKKICSNPTSLLAGIQKDIYYMDWVGFRFLQEGRRYDDLESDIKLFLFWEKLSFRKLLQFLSPKTKSNLGD